MGNPPPKEGQPADSGPGYYDVRDNSPRKAAGMGSKYNWVANDNPAPGQYNPEGADHITKSS